MSHTLALSKRGEVFAWGQGFYGALGLGNARNADKPQLSSELGKERIIDIAAGSRHSLFLSASQSKVFACGESKNGQLGIGNAEHQDRVLKPV